ncbi:hypothetical protein AM10699_27780 [Acaryochloris marina MBIC10699]|nr:hypothetical protein AM10699_27780 [Acaryochloris marina MBIC10699]
MRNDIDTAIAVSTTRILAEVECIAFIPEFDGFDRNIAISLCGPVTGEFGLHFHGRIIHSSLMT